MIDAIIKCYVFAGVVTFIHTITVVGYRLTINDEKAIKSRREFEYTKNDFYANGFGLVFWVLVALLTVCVAAYHFLVWPTLLMPNRCKK